MPQPLSDYFALEAGEFLDQLDALLRAPEPPDPVRFFRLARGVRGSAQIAGAEGVAAVAERLEDGARSLRDGVLAWSDDLRERALRTAEDLRALVAAHGRWGAAEDERAREAAARWGDAGGRRRGDQPGGGDQLFAFVRREIVVVVAELDRVLGELERDPAAGDALRGVLRRMRPVRGVAGMETLAPVLEVLEGIEDTAHEVLGRAAPATRAQLELLRAGRDALHAAGGSLEQGAALDSSPGLERFRELREGAEAADGGEAEAGVLPVSRLFYDDEGPHIVASPAAPVAEEDGRGGVPEEVESFLRIEATGFLDRAEGLISGRQGRAGRRFGGVARQLAELAASVRELAGTYGMTAIASAADEAASRLRGAASADEARAALARLRSILPGGGPESRAASDPAPAAPPPAAADVPSASPEAATATAGVAEVEPAPSADEPDVVPVEALIYAPDDALREALALRERVAALAGAQAGSGTPLGEALDELFGLVETALVARAAS